MFTIAEAARRAACPQSTIRYYERAGVLPLARRGDNGYRYFEAGDVERLAFVNRARELGFSIASVRDLLRLADHPQQPCEAIDTLLDEQVRSVRQRIAQLQALETRLAHLQRACDGEHPVHECGILAALSDTDIA
ncbi:MerR family DNA-binding protein [Salinisphaera hydrothermalis]|uniref:MerR family DNA-binding protein n=1 Tax=Salinisphaera TaxID=180541 RepID=UPI00333EF918